MSQSEDIEESSAPLIEHLAELRTRLMQLKVVDDANGTTQSAVTRSKIEVMQLRRRGC